MTVQNTTYLVSPVRTCKLRTRQKYCDLTIGPTSTQLHGKPDILSLMSGSGSRIGRPVLVTQEHLAMSSHTLGSAKTRDENVGADYFNIFPRLRFSWLEERSVSMRQEDTIALNLLGQVVTSSTRVADYTRRV